MEDVSRLVAACMEAERARDRAFEQVHVMAARAAAEPRQAVWRDGLQLARRRLLREVSRAKLATDRIAAGPHAYAWPWVLPDDRD